MSKHAEITEYRRCVGVMLINKAGLVWVGRRFDKQNDEGKGHWWQMPQGGIDKGEDPAVAALRDAILRAGLPGVTMQGLDPKYTLILVDGQRAKGVELGLVGRLTKNWSVAGGYAYQDGEILATQSATVLAGARLAQLPRHTVSLWNRYDLSKQWGAGVGLIYRDAIFASTDNTVRLPGFVRVDAAIFHRFDLATLT